MNLKDELPPCHELAPIAVTFAHRHPAAPIGQPSECPECARANADELRRLADEAGAIWMVAKGRVIDRRDRAARDNPMEAK